MAALMTIYEFFGPDHMVFGTDAPFGPDEGRDFIREALHSVQGMAVSAAEKESICAGNLLKLIGG